MIQNHTIFLFTNRHKHNKMSATKDELHKKIIYDVWRDEMCLATDISLDYPKQITKGKVYKDLWKSIRKLYITYAQQIEKEAKETDKPYKFNYPWSYELLANYLTQFHKFSLKDQQNLEWTLIAHYKAYHKKIYDRFVEEYTCPLTEWTIIFPIIEIR